MEETKKYIQAFLSQNKIEVIPSKLSLFDDFIANEENIKNAATALQKEEAAQLVGEAYAVRALAYFDLVKFFARHDMSLLQHKELWVDWTTLVSTSGFMKNQFFRFSYCNVCLSFHCFSRQVNTHRSLKLFIPLLVPSCAVE